MPTSHRSTLERYQAARLVGSLGLVILAAFTVHMPGGYLGPANALTAVGVACCAAAVLLTALSVYGLVAGRRWAGIPALTTLGLSIALFLPALVSDPLIAGAVVLWNLVSLGRFLFPTVPMRQHPGDRRSSVEADRVARWLERTGPAARHLLTVAVLATVATVGYGIGQRSVALAVCLALDLLAVAVAASLLLLLLRRRSWAAAAPVVLLAGAAALAGQPAVALSLAAAANTLTLVLILVHTRAVTELVELFYGQPALLVLTSFILLIALGTLLLTFPAASATAQPVRPIDALFTATSAACVTGLVVRDTPNDLSLLGHIVILLLIQAGGLNIMVLSTFAAILLGRGLGLRGERALGEMLDLRVPGSAYRLVVLIVLVTFGVEAAGAAGLSAAYLGKGYELQSAVWHGLFHSVSAFCNAGFALQTDSLVMFQADAWVLLLVAALITLGGLGFPVLAFVWLRLSGRARVGLAVQVRVVLVASALLSLVGGLVFAAAEWSGSLAGLTPAHKLVNALFQSVTCRTAGFSSVAFDQLQPTVILTMMVLMFIGASPGGTGGGIKTTTMVVLLSAIPTLARGSGRVELWRRTISLDTVFRSAAIAVIASLVVVLGTGALLASQPGDFAALLFEAISAFGTVGLSLGVTQTLDTLGKTAIILIMVAGRIGPLTLALLLGRKVAALCRYPEARIMVG